MGILDRPSNLLGGRDVRLRTNDDLAGCVRALEAVHSADDYPTRWPVDPAGWLSPSGCAEAWVATDEVMGSILGHVCFVRGVDDPMVASLIGVSTDRLASVSRLFVSPAARGRGLGLGTSLLAAVSSWTSAHDFRLMLDVVDDGAPAIKLYERLGWRLVDRRKTDGSPRMANGCPCGSTSPQKTNDSGTGPDPAGGQQPPHGDPLRTPVNRGGPIPRSDRRSSRSCHRDLPLLLTCIAMHRRRPAELPDVCREECVTPPRSGNSPRPARNALTTDAAVH